MEYAIQRLSPIKHILTIYVDHLFDLQFEATVLERDMTKGIFSTTFFHSHKEHSAA